MLPRIAQLWVDTDVCLAHYLCTDLAPLYFVEAGDGGYGVAVRLPDAGAMRPDEIARVYRAAAHCPTGAIKIKTMSGHVMDAYSAELKELRQR